MRDIKNGYFTWLEREAVKKIKTIPYKQRGSSLLVYFGICDISSEQKDEKEICCFKFDIAEKSCVSEKTVQRCLPLLESLDIIKISPQDRKSNGRFEKIKIWLNRNNLAAGQLRDSSETDARQMRDTKSDTIKKVNKEKETYTSEEIKNLFNSPLAQSVVDVLYLRGFAVEKKANEPECFKSWLMELWEDTGKDAEKWRRVTKEFRDWSEKPPRKIVNFKSTFRNFFRTK